MTTGSPVISPRIPAAILESEDLRRYFPTDPESPLLLGLIERVIEASDRETLNARVRALDRVLRAMHIWVPQWYKGVHNIAYRDVFGRPYTETPPPLSLGSSSIWWWDEDKAQSLRDAGAL